MFNYQAQRWEVNGFVTATRESDSGRQQGGSHIPRYPSHSRRMVEGDIKRGTPYTVREYDPALGLCDDWYGEVKVMGHSWNMSKRLKFSFVFPLRLLLSTGFFPLDSQHFFVPGVLICLLSFLSCRCFDMIYFAATTYTILVLARS